MQTVRKLTACVLAALMTLASPAGAQQRHVVDPSALAAAVAQHVDRQEADRAAIRQALGSRYIRQLADRLGFDVDRAAARIDTLADAELIRASAAARQINDQLVGGQRSITITTTTIIIALLIIILIIVAVD